MSSATKPETRMPEPAAVAAGSANKLTPAQLTAQLELAVVLLLHRWPALTTAVAASWGGPDSADKRSWFAGFLADYLASTPAADAEDVESVLLDFMEAEFGARLEDDSEIDVARECLAVRKQLAVGDKTAVESLKRWWETRTGKSESIIAQGHLPAGMSRVANADGEDADEEEWSEDESDNDEEDGGVDIDMADAPQLVPAPPRPKAVPEVDEDGFTKVVSKKRR